MHFLHRDGDVQCRQAYFVLEMSAMEAISEMVHRLVRESAYCISPQLSSKCHHLYHCAFKESGTGR